MVDAACSFEGWQKASGGAPKEPCCFLRSAEFALQAHLPVRDCLPKP